MDTTTPVDGVASSDAVNAPAGPTQPIKTEAVADDSQTAPVKQGQDDESTSTDQDQNADAASGESTPPEAQANDEAELAKFAKAKGYDSEKLTDGERKALDMARNAEKKMHEATQTAKTNIEPPQEVPLTGQDNIDEVIARQNASDLKLYVRDWFDANPDMKEHRQDLQKIADERPWLQNMDDVKAHFLADPNRTAQIEKEGGRKALTNLAQKQQAIPPSANANNSGVFESSKITPENVDELVAKNDQAWYIAHRAEIQAAAFGNART